jgi:predicted secreted protein
MSDGIHGHGATLKCGATAVGNITSISGPSQARDPIDISTMDSTSKHREFIPGMLDAGEISFDCNYDGTAAGSANFLNTWRTNTADTWTVTFNNNGTTSSWACKAFITALGHAIPFDDKVTQSVTVKCTGVPTYTDQA